jgi:hypothetical protein
MIALNSLWVGNKLGYVERLCLASALAVGHKFTLFSYEPSLLTDVPDGVNVRDARDIMPVTKLLRYTGSGAVQLGANLFRYELMKFNYGIWVDMDFCFVNSVLSDAPYLFGWEYENTINNAILMTSPESKITKDLCTLPQANRRPAWYGPKRSFLYYLKRIKGPVRVEDFPWGTFGPGMLTYLVKKHDLLKYAKPPHVFYPVSWKDAHLTFEVNSGVYKMIRKDTCGIHLWSSRIRDFVSRPPPKGSFVFELCKQFGVEPVN